MGNKVFRQKRDIVKLLVESGFTPYEADKVFHRAQVGVAYGTRHAAHRKADHPTRAREYRPCRAQIKSMKLQGTQRAGYRSEQIARGHFHSSFEFACEPISSGSSSLASSGSGYTGLTTRLAMKRPCLSIVVRRLKLRALICTV